MKKDKLKIFKSKAQIIHGDKYNYSNSKFVTVDTKLLIGCNIDGHGTFLQSPYKHINRKQGCPLCGIEKNRKTRMKPYSKFLKQAISIHGEKYDYSESETDYDGAFHKIKIKCKLHGEFYQTPDNHVNDKKGCYYCGLESNRRLYIRSQEEFLKLAKNVHGDLYLYCKSKYTGANDKITIICKTHGEWEQSPTSHLKGHNCPKCTGNAGLTLAQFIKKAKSIHGETFDYKKVNYINAHIKITIGCQKHGDFKQTPSDHIYSNGKGCPKCKETTGERKIRVFLENHKIEYEYQKKFKDCRDKNKLPFDFYLQKYNLLIEYDGIQHYEPVEIWGGIKAHESLKRRDRIKSEFAKLNRIKLIRIAYFELDLIEKILNEEIEKSN